MPFNYEQRKADKAWFTALIQRELKQLNSGIKYEATINNQNIKTEIAKQVSVALLGKLQSPEGHRDDVRL